MRRVHLFELEDQSWLPGPIRDASTDFLRFMLEAGDAYGPIVPKLKDALMKTGGEEILDLCSGGAGPVIDIQKKLAKAGCTVRITLTDKYPNHAAFKHARKCSGGLDFIEDSVDATAVPAHLSGFRTLFNSFHHFRPEMAQRILQDAVDQRRPIGVFDFSARRLPPQAVMLLGNPLAILALTPFIRPFRWGRLFWTYIVPIAPLCLMWDGFASGFRLYSTQELQGLADGLRSDDYAWEIGRAGAFTGSITYLIGYPK